MWLLHQGALLWRAEQELLPEPPAASQSNWRQIWEQMSSTAWIQCCSHPAVLNIEAATPIFQILGGYCPYPAMSSVLSTPGHLDRSLFWHHSFHSCFASYFARSIFFIIIIITIILSPIPLRLFFRSLSQAVFNSLELFRIYMIILRSANRKQSHVVLGIFLTCCKKCISPLWSYRQSQLHRQMMSDSPCPSSQRKFVQELETEPLCYKSQSQKQKTVLLQILLIDIISLHGGLFWVTGMGLKYFHVGFHPASLRWTHYNEFSNAFWFGFVFLLLTTQIHDREQ